MKRELSFSRTTYHHNRRQTIRCLGTSKSILGDPIHVLESIQYILPCRVGGGGGGGGGYSRYPLYKKVFDSKKQE